MSDYFVYICKLFLHVKLTKVTYYRYVILEFREFVLDETIIDWLININPSQNTKHSYLTAMQQYTKLLRKIMNNY